MQLLAPSASAAVLASPASAAAAVKSAAVVSSSTGLAARASSSQLSTGWSGLCAELSSTPAAALGVCAHCGCGVSVLRLLLPSASVVGLGARVGEWASCGSQREGGLRFLQSSILGATSGVLSGVMAAAAVV